MRQGKTYRWRRIVLGLLLIAIGEPFVNAMVSTLGSLVLAVPGIVAFAIAAPIALGVAFLGHRIIAPVQFAPRPQLGLPGRRHDEVLARIREPQLNEVPPYRR